MITLQLFLKYDLLLFSKMILVECAFSFPFKALFLFVCVCTREHVLWQAITGQIQL